MRDLQFKKSSIKISPIQSNPLPNIRPPPSQIPLPLAPGLWAASTQWQCCLLIPRATAGERHSITLTSSHPHTLTCPLLLVHTNPAASSHPPLLTPLITTSHSLLTLPLYTLPSSHPHLLTPSPPHSLTSSHPSHTLTRPDSKAVSRARTLRA